MKAIRAFWDRFRRWCFEDTWRVAEEYEAWRLAAIETTKRDKARGEAFFALLPSEQKPEGALAALAPTKLRPQP